MSQETTGSRGSEPAVQDAHIAPQPNRWRAVDRALRRRAGGLSRRVLSNVHRPKQERSTAQTSTMVSTEARRLGWYVDSRSDEQFIEAIYRRVLNREVDGPGLHWLRSRLAGGEDRVDIALELAFSEESINHRLADQYPLTDLRQLRPDSFMTVCATTGEAVEVFEARKPDDFDWLERAMLEEGYYEKPGIWTMGVDEDKQRMAELLALFGADPVLELGCAAGAVLQCLDERGFHVTGIDISHMAARRAHPRVRDRIMVGDLLELDLPPHFRLIFALDVFEHLNPNRFERYTKRVAEILAPGGFLFVNSPAYGTDPVYGELFPMFLPSWQEDARRGRLFSQLQVDKDGYPMHGHLVWADSGWWVSRLEQAGLRRETKLELALHRRFDSALEAETPARKAFFVFSKDAAHDSIDRVVRQIQQ